MATQLIPIQTNFTAGQIDELLDGRVDIAKYNNGLRVSKNFVIFQQGGAKGRPGLRFVAEKGVSGGVGSDSSRKAILLPFSFSIDQNYALEVGHHYIRFFTDNGRLENPPGTPVQVETDYSEEDLFGLKFTQSADVMYITHPSHPQKQLRRLSATSWTLTDLAANPPAIVEADADLGATLSLGAATGTNVTASAGAGVFLQSDVGRQIVSLGGIASIISFTDASNVQVDILADFPQTSFASGEWFVNGSPAADLTANEKGPINKIMTLSTTIPTFRASDVGKFVRIWDGVIRITSFNNAQDVNGIILSLLTDTAAAIAGTWTLEVNSWSEERGYPRAVGFHDQRLMFAGSNSEPDTLWASHTGKFSIFSGGVKDADPFRYVLSANQVNVIEWLSSQKELILGTSGAEFKMSGSINDPLTPSNVHAKSQTAWGSSSIMPIRADRSTIFVTTGGKILRAVRYSFDDDGYLADDLMLLAASIGYPGITQLSFEKFPVPLLWATRSDGKLLSMTFDPGQEVLAWSVHETDGEFESVCSIVSPDKKKSQTWVIVKRTIGGVTKRYIEFFDQAERISDRHPILVDSGLSYDGTNNDATLTASDAPAGENIEANVTVTVGGATSNGEVFTVTPAVVALIFTSSIPAFSSADVGKQIVEIGGIGRATIMAFIDSSNVTAAITSPFSSDDPLPATAWGLGVKEVSGLDHLEGKEVQIVGDGAAFPHETVVDGSVILNGPHSLKIDVGLLFVPEMTTLRPAVNTRHGNTVFLTKGYSKVYVLFHNTLGAQVNGDQVPFRSSADAMGVAPPIKSDIFKVGNLGYDSDARITIKQEQPLPITVLAIQGILDIGDE